MFKVKVTDTTWLLWTILSFGNVGCTLAAAYCYSPPSGIPTLLRLMATANVPSRPKTIIVVKLVVYTTEKSPFFSLTTQQHGEVRCEIFMSSSAKFVRSDASNLFFVFSAVLKLDFFSQFCSQILGGFELKHSSKLVYFLAR